MKKLLPLTCLLAFLASCVSAQDGTEIHLFVSPANAWVRIDGKTIIDFTEKAQPVIAKVEPGDYPIEVWAVGFLVHRDTVKVEAGKKTEYRCGLTKKDPTYAAYKMEINRRSKILSRQIALDAGLGAGAVACWVVGLAKGDAKGIRKDLLDAKEAYETAITPLELDLGKSTFATLSEKYDDARKKERVRRAIFLPAAVGLTAGTIWAIVSQKKRRTEWPKYDAKNPFAFRPLFDWSPSTGSAIGLCLQF